MPNQISISGNMQVVLSPGNIQEVASLSCVIAVAGSTFNKSIQSIATTETAISLPGVPTPRYVLLKNLDTANYVDVGVITADYAIRLQPGDIALFPVKVAALFALAHTAAVELQIFAVEA